MKTKLKHHATEICKIVFAFVGIHGTPNILVFDCNNDTDYPPFDGLDKTHEYLVLCEYLMNHDSMNAVRDCFANNFGKEVLFFSKENRSWLYWHEGEVLHPAPETVDSRENHHNHSISTKKTHTCLPSWLDSLIYDKLGAIYCPDFKRFEHNLELSESDLNIYLGTYFPRSYAEAFCIFDGIFDNTIIRDVIVQKRKLWVLDIGSGCGGDLIGLLTAIVKHLHCLEEINIIAIDGHIGALHLLEQIIYSFKTHTQKLISLEKICSKIIDSKSLPIIGHSGFDFIISCKMANEQISRGQGRNDDAYSAMLEQYCSTLNDTGLFLLLDVTTKPDHADYYPCLLNQQVGSFIASHPEFRTLLPLPCSYFEAKCAKGCFTQRRFAVSCKGRSNVLSKVAYRILGHRSFVNSVNGLKSNKSFVFPSITGNSTNDRVCQCDLINENKRVDAYTL